MDKPFQTKFYAGLVIYRVQRNPEFLILNDSFSKKKHWFCPKGEIIGNEDEIKCALRETFEITGLHPSNLHIEEGFALELKYLSGNRPKKVKYYLAQLLDTRTRVLASGLYSQWCNYTAASDKVVFKSMQEVLKHAQTYIESRPKRKTQTQPISPLYKTRLCERYETEGSCPYGVKCNFAHGVQELRREQELQQPQPQQQKEDQLFKTKLCDRYMKDKFCQYGPKCLFAHGEEELKTRPVTKKEEEDQKHSKREGRHETTGRADQKDNWRSNLGDQKTNWRPHEPDVKNQRQSEPNKSNSSDHKRTSPTLVMPSLSPERKKAEEEPRRRHITEESNEKSWMKIVKISQEEQDELERQSEKKTVQVKSSHTETMIAELKGFFTHHPPVIPSGKIAEDVKEVTRIEMRNDVTKQQLLYILLVSLLEDELDPSMLTVLKSREHLFKTFVKNDKDQLLLLKAWDKLVSVRKQNMIGKTSAALSYWYDCEMVDEDTFLSWYDSLEKDSLMYKKSSKFIEWLNQEDEDE